MTRIVFGEGTRRDAPLYAVFSIPLFFPPSWAPMSFQYDDLKHTENIHEM